MNPKVKSILSYLGILWLPLIGKLLEYKFDFIDL